MDSDEAKFTLASNDPVGFVSYRSGDPAEAQPTRETGVDPLPVPACANASTEPRERKEMATQTISAPHSKKFATYDDSKLVSFIRRVQPIVEEELSYGITPIFDCNDNDLYDRPTGRYRVCRHQELQLAPPDQASPCTSGAAAWLSILTRDAPLLALACSPSHGAWCEHVGAVVCIFGPKRTRYGASVQWEELCRSPVKACIETLETNPFNRDMFAGGTVSGDVYIWRYEPGDLLNNCFVELHSETTDCGKVVDMAWARYSVMSKADSALLTAHSEGTVILWRVGKTILKDKIFKLATSGSGSRPALMLTRILATSNTEFVAGCADGSLLLCSTTQLIPLGSAGSAAGVAAGAKGNYFAPGTIELKGHSFAVTSLQKVDSRRQELLISCDLTGEVFFHDITDTINSSPALIIKMPLPFKTRIACTADTEFIFSPSEHGRLELYRIGSGRVDTVEASLTLPGTPNLIKMTANGKWLITGTYNGTFIVYSVATDY